MNNYIVELKEIYLKYSPFEIYILFSNLNYEKISLLESSLTQSEFGRYSILGLNLIEIIDEKNYKTINDFYDNLQYKLEYYAIDLDSFDIKLPIMSGAIGFFAYDAYEINMQLKSQHLKTEINLNRSKACFYVYENLIIFDHIENKTYVTSLHKKNSENYHQNLNKILESLSHININDIRNNIKNLKKTALEHIEISSNFEKEEYLNAINQVKNYIYDGHIYVMNLTQQLFCKTSKTALEIYALLREINPSPFGGLFQHDDFFLISSSPERFLKIEDHQIETRPIKGTSPRYPNDLKQDNLSKISLSQNEKDKSELLMIIDLERNDLNQFCELHSVKVPNLYDIESYSTVHHLVATIRGKIKKNYKILDCFRVCFPGGSITGAPKQRAMEIISELEQTNRSIYTGCLGYLSFHNSCDFNILIRTILLQDGVAYFGVGGGITWESEIQAEFDETLLKAKALIQSLL